MTTKHKKNLSIQTYVDKNRNSIDEALVSLRLMKEIDNFLDEHKITNRELATSLEYTESYISQLMSGTKNVNMSFINKFEKKYNVELEFRFRTRLKDTIRLMDSKTITNFQIVQFEIPTVRKKYTSFEIKAKNTDLLEYDEAKYENV